MVLQGRNEQVSLGMHLPVLNGAIWARKPVLRRRRRDPQGERLLSHLP